MDDAQKSNKTVEEGIDYIEELCTSAWEPVYRFIYYKVQNREEAEDITQETFVKAISHLQKNNIRIERCIGFLKAVSLNVLRDRWRRNKHRGTRVNIEEVNPLEVAVDDPSEQTSERILIEKAMKELSEEQRMVIELRIIKGYSAAETAGMMDKKEGTIRVLQYRALQNLAAILKKID
jgi:RNA polymerase sigma-70 factor (ECF subfamily)